MRLFKRFRIPDTKLAILTAGIVLFLLVVLSDGLTRAATVLTNHVFLPTVLNRYDGAPPPTATPAPSATATPTPIVLGTPSRLGIWAGDLAGVQREMVDSMVSAGAKWVRVTIEWSRIQTSRTTYDFSAYDTPLRSLAVAGLLPIVAIRENPTWAAATVCGPVTDTSAFQDFLRTLVLQYSQPPYSVKHWEFYNEPDNKSISSGTWAGGCWGNNPVEYTAMLERATNVIKGVGGADPDAKIVFGGLAMGVHPSIENNIFNMNFAADVLAEGAGSFFDIMNIHYFASQEAMWSSYGRDIGGKVGAIRSVMANAGVSKPVVVTEMSWTYPAADSATYQELQARYVPKVLAQSLAIDLYASTWFTLNWDNDYQYGLLDSLQQPRPAYFAFQQAATEFGQASTVRPLSPAEVGIASGVEGYVFRVDGQERWVLWATGGAIAIHLPANASAAKGKLGSSIPLPGGDEPTKVLLDDDPIYVRF